MADIDNLKVQEQLNKVINDRRVMLASQTREMQSQLQVALQLKAVMDGMTSDELVQRLNAAQAALDAIGKNAEQLNQTAGQAMVGISKGAQKAADGTGKLEKQTKLLIAKYPMLKSLGTAALSGLAQGFTNLMSLTKGIVGVVEGLTSGLFNVGKAILAIPLRIFQGLLDSAAAMTGDTSLAQAFEDLRKEFGNFKEDVSKNVIGSFHEIQKGLTGTGLSAMKVFGPLANQLKYFHEMASKAGAQIHQFGEEMAQTAGAFAAFEKGMGIGENLKAFMDRATVSGTTLGEQFRTTANYALQMGKDFGISQKVLSKDIGMMLKDVKNFGSLTQKEMSVAAVYTRKLGMEVKDLLGLIDKFDNFEDAANSAAMLNQTFGASVDAFKMMQEQDPAKRMDMLRKSMQAAGKTTENMTRQELKLLASTTNMTEEAAKLAFSAKNQGVSYDEIQKKAAKAEKSQLTQAQALSKLADSIERFIQQGQQLHGSFFKMFMEGFERGVKTSKPFMELMINLRRALMDTMFAGMEVGRAFVKTFPGITKSLESLSAMFAPGRFQKLLGGVVESFKVFFKDLEGGQYSVKKLLKMLQENFTNWFDSNSAEGKGLLDGAKKILKTFAGIVGEGIRYVIERLTDGFKMLAEFVTSPSKFMKKYGAAAGGAKSAGMEILEPLMNALGDKTLWANLWGSLKMVFNALFDKAKAYFTSAEFKDIVKEYWPIIAGILFGPALTRVLAAAFVQTIAKVFSGGASSISNAMKGGLKGVAKSVEGAAGAGKAGAPDALAKSVPDENQMGGLSGAIKGLAKLKASEVAKAGVNALILSAFIGGSLIILITAIAASAKILESFKISTTSLLQVLLAIGVIAVEMIPMIVAIKIAAKVPLGEVLKGLLAMGVVIAAMGAALAIITGIFSVLKLSTSDAKNISVAMAAMGLTFIAAGAVTMIALGLGAVLTALGPFAAVALIGLAAMVVVIEAMALTVISIMVQLNKVPVGAGFEEKVHAFSEIMKAIGSLTSSLAAMLEASRPSWVELLGGKGSTLENLKQLQGFVTTFIGHIQGLVTTIMQSVATMATSPEMIKAAEAFGSIMSGVATMAAALVPPADTKSTMDSVMNAIRGESSDTQLVDATNYVKRFIGNVEPFIVGIKKTVTDLAALQIDEKGMKGIDAFGKVMNAVTSIMSAVKPSPDMINAMKDSITTTTGSDLTKANTMKGQALIDLGTYFQKVMESTGPLIKAVTGDAVKSVMVAADNFDMKKMDKVKAVLGIISAVGGMMAPLGEIAAKTGSSANFKRDGDKVESTVQMFPTIAKIMSQLEEHIPKLISVFTGLPDVVGSQKFASKMAGIKSAFDIVTALSTIFKNVSADSGKNINSDGIVLGVANIATGIGRIFFGTGAFGTGGAPMMELISHLRFIADNSAKYLMSTKELDVAESIKKTSAALTQISKSMAELQQAGLVMAGVDFSKMPMADKMMPGKDKVAPFIIGLGKFATDLGTASKAVGENALTPSLNAIKTTVAAVNDLNTLLASGDATNIKIGTNLKKFVDNSGLGNKASYTIQNKGVTMTVNMDVHMKAEDVEEALIFRKTSVIREAIKDSSAFDSNEPLKNKLRSF